MFYRIPFSPSSNVVLRTEGGGVLLASRPRWSDVERYYPTLLAAMTDCPFNGVLRRGFSGRTEEGRLSGVSVRFWVEVAKGGEESDRRRDLWEPSAPRSNVWRRMVAEICFGEFVPPESREAVRRHLDSVRDFGVALA